MHPQKIISRRIDNGKMRGNDDLLCLDTASRAICPDIIATVILRLHLLDNGSFINFQIL